MSMVSSTLVMKSSAVFAENNPDDHQNEEIYQTLIFLTVVDGIPIGCQLNEGHLESRKSRINDAGNLGRLLKLKIWCCVTLNVDMDDSDPECQKSINQG